MNPDIEDESGLEEIYARICEGNEWLQLIPFEDGHMLRMGEGPMPILWMNRPDGAIAVQWQGADSEEQLLNFALENAVQETWDEEVSFDAGDGLLYLAASTEVIWLDYSPSLCEVSLPPGRYQVTAKWLETDSTMAIIFRFSRVS